MPIPIADDALDASCSMMLFEVDADGPGGARRCWLIVAPDGGAARRKVPAPFRPAREVKPRGYASGPGRVIGWCGEPLAT